ncbi:MAG: hypothetical protein IPK35_23585 [Saprospiraceae bacterium]|jgi:hypothetical protein|nr:hypothetical protein [Saprospiraceae bacterium]
MLSNAAQKAIDVYGGADFWQDHKYIEAEVSVNGLAFTLKRRPFFKLAKIKMEIGRPFSKITPVGKNETISGVLDGNDVHLENNRGEIIAQRNNARNFFPYGRRLFYWDDLDMAYFANYAFWNYFTLPNLLMNENIHWIEKSVGHLIATFPDNFPTHSKVQEFFFDINTGLLKQHNYTAEVISSLATAANVVTEHKDFHGILLPSRRIVTPRFGDKILSKPILIDIFVHSLIFTN